MPSSWPDAEGMAGLSLVLPELPQASRQAVVRPVVVVARPALGPRVVPPLAFRRAFPAPTPQVSCTPSRRAAERWRTGPDSRCATAGGGAAGRSGNSSNPAISVRRRLSGEDQGLRGGEPRLAKIVEEARVHRLARAKAIEQQARACLQLLQGVEQPPGAGQHHTVRRGAENRGENSAAFCDDHPATFDELP
ncbi:hypothetical protein GMDG_08720 [Pseudogymnoascus destructans 20631-21]|uniref:Uncharacterized protein n=1 Tax=Pseudogymnoascus destructans (strain ATCC MYA-4855 / 20631-21) TaxID=658429 RepID=L8GB53_PSED2|nr:hypothetical protein GMDG_08720 [Pseudogymnoascus destructans 20631-21]